MDIDVNHRCLGAVDVDALRDRILEQPTDVWMEQALRQQSYEVHRDTQSIVMLFCDEEWPASGSIYEESGHDRLADVAQPIIDHVINTWYAPGGLVIRAIAAKLLSGGKIPAHRDSIDSFHIGHRIHVPITTNPGVRFTIAGKPYPFDVGYAYEINNQQKHSVMNLGAEDRITFIFDYVPPDKVPANAA